MFWGEKQSVSKVYRRKVPRDIAVVVKFWYIITRIFPDQW